MDTNVAELLAKLLDLDLEGCLLVLGLRDVLADGAW
jgi:hypothetical protein